MIRPLRALASVAAMLEFRRMQGLMPAGMKASASGMAGLDHKPGSWTDAEEFAATASAAAAWRKSLTNHGRVFEGSGHIQLPVVP